MARVLYIVLAILVALAGLAFHVRNNQAISLDFYVRSFTVDLSWVVVAALVGGVLLGACAMAASLLRLRHEVRRLRRRNEQASRELTSLRAVALKDAG